MTLLDNLDVHVQVYVLKRPHVDAFMKRVGELYEVVIFTASLSKVGSSTYTHMHIFIHICIQS